MVKISVLRLMLHDTLIGYLTGAQDGRNCLIFDETFKADPSRPTLSLITRPDFPYADKILATPWVRTQRLHPVLSNLLPEGALRELITQGLKTHPDNEFQLFTYLGRDLPGALIAEPLSPEEVPLNILTSDIQVIPVNRAIIENRFSLAGVQIKFSMKENDGRFLLSKTGALGDWIIKTPSTKHKNVPLNEYTAMMLASLAGVDIPEIKLVEVDKLDNLPQINLPEERYAFAIKRFDRDNTSRIHMEDFAQVLVKYPHQKYNSASYEQIGKIIYQFTGNGLANAQQFARRLLVNILLANGDAHLKNWSLLYKDRFTAELAPAYDIVTTRVYIEGEKDYALNLGKTKQWYQVTMDNFEAWAKKADIPWRAIKPHLDDTQAKARSLWPDALDELPMDTIHKEKLKLHWQSLQKDFKILTD
ncbi:type II toxin-antitoxin system HipA family toxin [Methylicorpusculum sp.]|uniref:type II toxin-antitoxin system HipA family toxin n=1 Tax=Methylicorpusculum sp. TaxID=2713644 RepID=UPI00271DFD58|nr:type II toxin-antitoxin system HipA family toxin [Methylicorpusculum sp.]MDO8845098.1 type II toxin-antitoxin system HipA family toxin [Methylicorpusculum sp.]